MLKIFDIMPISLSFLRSRSPSFSLSQKISLILLFFSFDFVLLFLKGEFNK